MVVLVVADPDEMVDNDWNEWADWIESFDGKRSCRASDDDDDDDDGDAIELDGCVELVDMLLACRMCRAIDVNGVCVILPFDDS